MGPKVNGRRASDPAADRPLVGEADQEGIARAIVLRMLERQPRTRAELARGMARRGVPEDAATAVLDRFTDVGLIDDAAFAAAWVDSRHAGRGLARRALSAELRQRGVAPDVIDEAVAAVTHDDEEAAARALVRRRLPSVARLPRETQLRRLTGMLARKGFAQGLAVRVVRDAVDESLTGRLT